VVSVCVCACVCVSVGQVRESRKTAEPIEMPFGTLTMVGLRNHILDTGSRSPTERGNFDGVSV